MRVREILDQGGCPDVTIFASSSVDEYVLEDLMDARAPIDGFGIGTHLDTSADRPYLDCAYKLQEYAGKACRKRSEGKATWPGRKQVFRVLNQAGRLDHDVLTLEKAPEQGEPLLRPVMGGGKRLGPQEGLSSLRQRTARELERLPDGLRSLTAQSGYEVRVSTALRSLADRVDTQKGH